MNLTAEDLASGVLRDRVKVGASLADVDPMNLDTSVSENVHKCQRDLYTSINPVAKHSYLLRVSVFIVGNHDFLLR